MIEQFYTDLDGLIRIPSVATDGDDAYPFGKACADALDYTLSLCESFGFRTKKCGNMLGWAEIGEGDEMIGILAHLDVVPEGAGWDYPAFALTRVSVDGEERLYGRGVTDDKGPAMMCIYAMRVLANSGAPLNKRVRTIFGLTEERGEWVDMEYYKANEELPTFGFTPDASFPVGYAEKGIAVFELTMPKSAAGIDTVSGGNAHNMVPDYCECTINDTKFSANGVSVHGSVPASGKNAILACMREINEKSPCALSEFITKKFSDDCDGAGLGINMSDAASGALTLNLGVIEVRGEDVVMTIDIRYPVIKNYDAILTMLRANCEQYGVSVKPCEHKGPVYIDKNGKFVKTLCDIYNGVTGDNAKPFSMGGGTYARAMPNIVSFGPAMPGEVETAHQKNEYTTVAAVDTAVRIYAQTLLELMDI